MEFVNPSNPDTYFGVALTTYRNMDLDANAASFFQYECVVAAIAVFFSRWTISKKGEPPLMRLSFALLLGFLAYSKKAYELVCAVHIFSYAVPMLLTHKSIPNDKKSLRLALIGVSAGLSLLLSHVILSREVWSLVVDCTPLALARGMNYLFPIEEFAKAQQMLLQFMDPAVLRKEAAHLFFATFHIQVGMGYLGIDFLRKEQARRNQLVQMDMMQNGEQEANGGDDSNKASSSPAKMEASRRFQKSAAPFILFTAVPYMLQIIALGNVNRFAFLCVQHDLVRAVRLNNVFENDSHLLAMANDSATSPGSTFRVAIYFGHMRLIQIFVVLT